MGAYERTMKKPQIIGRSAIIGRRSAHRQLAVRRMRIYSPTLARIRKHHRRRWRRVYTAPAIALPANHALGGGHS